MDFDEIWWKSLYFAENCIKSSKFSCFSLKIAKNRWFSMKIHDFPWFSKSGFYGFRAILAVFRLNLLEIEQIWWISCRLVVEKWNPILASFWLNSIEFWLNSIEFDENPIIWWKSLIFHQIIVDLSKMRYLNLDEIYIN